MKKTRNDLIKTYEYLRDETKHSTKADKTRRGRTFENLLRDLMEIEDLSPRLNSFRPKGEELDGSFLFGHKVFLLEAKWHAEPLPASSIYQFKGKVDGKLVGTVGFFISMSGFSTDAVDALAYGKSLNVILFDGNDFDHCIKHDSGFTKALEEKLRAATESGLPFYSLNPVIRPTRRKNKSAKEPLSEIVIVVEGQGDQEIISFLADKILKQNKIERNLMIRTAGGKVSVPTLANAIDDFSDGKKYKFILVADADADVDETANLLSKSLNEGIEPALIIPDPEIEIWFQQLKIYDRNDLKSYAREHRTKPSQARQYVLNKIDLDALYHADESFRLFYDALTT